MVAGVRNPDEAQELLELKASHSKALCILELDVSDTASITAWAAAVAEKFESVDLLINNAGILQWSGIEDVTADQMIESYKVRPQLRSRSTQAKLPLVYCDHILSL